MFEPKIEVTVSLSTTPKRVNMLLPTLKTLLNQTRPPDRILLCIPSYCARLDQHLESIPEYLLTLEQTTQLQIIQTEDYGPATKFIPASKYLKPDENHFLIWLDDDILYTETLVEELVKNCPERSAISVTGFKLLPNHHKMELRHLKEADILEGWGGVCCRVADLPDLEKHWSRKPYSEMTYIEKCHWHSDDYVMSRVLQDSGIRTVVCCTEKLTRFMNEPLDFGLQVDALQNSSMTAGHQAAYGALEHKRSFDRLIKDLKEHHYNKVKKMAVW